MQQLSRPYQIVLGALLVFVLAWFTVLKPSAADEVEPLPGPSAATSAPGAAGLGNAVDKADGAAAASDANAAASQAAAATATGEPAAPSPSATTPAPAPSAPTQPAPAVAPAPADPSAAILRAVADGKVAVMLFSGSGGADDRAVRRALKAVDRRDGKVVVRAAPIARVAEYAAITEGVDVLQAPTLLVIGKGNRARALVGYVDTRAIDQLVADAGR